MEVIFELLAETILQAVFEVLAEFGFRAVRAPFQSPRETSPVLAVMGYALFGAAAGGLSLLVFPSGFITYYPARIANLVITPIAAGALMGLLGAWRAKRGQALIRLDRFAYGMVFAFAMGVVRFVFAQHGG